MGDPADQYGKELGRPVALADRTRDECQRPAQPAIFQRSHVRRQTRWPAPGPHPEAGLANVSPARRGRQAIETSVLPW